MSTNLPALRGALSVGGARAFLLPISGVASLFAAHIVLAGDGPTAFAVFSILITLPALVPVSDFGLSTPVTDAIARHGLNSTQFVATWRRSRSLLWSIAAVTIVAALVITITVGWSALLGIAPTAAIDWAAFSVITFMAVGIPLGASQRILLGVGRQVLATVAQTTSTVVGLALLLITNALPTANVATQSVAYAAGPLIAQILMRVAAAQYLKELPKSVWRSRQTFTSSTSLLREAWPMVVLMCAGPLLYQSDRVLLAHNSTTAAVAAYSLVALLYSPLLSVIVAGQQPLWPAFMRRRAHGEPLVGLTIRALASFTALGIALALGLLLAGPLVLTAVGKDASRLPLSLFLAFGGMLVMFGFNATPGMLMMTKQGRLIQAIGSVAALGAKLALSVVLIPQHGPAGVVIASLLGAGLLMVIPTATVALHQVWHEQRRASLLQSTPQNRL